MTQKNKGEEEDYFYPDYNYGYCWLNRFLFFTHILCTVTDTRKKLLKQIEDGEDQMLEVSDTPKIPRDQGCDALAKALYDCIQDHISQGNELTENSMFKIVLWTFRLQILQCWGFYMMQAAFRLAASVMIQQILTAAMTRDQDKAYWSAGILLALVLFAAIFRHNAFYESAILNNRIKNAFIYTIYQKVSGLSQFMIRNADMGKVINMLASDFNTMEIKMTFVFMAMTLPFVAIGAAIILVFRLGWIGLICIAIPFVFLPIIGLIGKNSGSIQREVNQFKDKRIKTTTDVIQGIRFIKLYAWQIAFNKMIGYLRESQIAKYLRMYFNQSFQRAISNTSSYWAVFITFIIIYFTQGDGILNAARIFSTTELMGYFKLLVFLGGSGLSFMFELKVIFKRFVDIYQIKNFNMRKIDESTKQPFPIVERQNTNKTQQMPTQQAIQSNQAIMLQDLNVDAGSEHLEFGEIEMINFNAYWSTTDFATPSIKNMNLKIEKGKFYGIAGKVGSGKSGLLSCFLKQPPYYSGDIHVKGSVAYVQQEPYIFAGTVRQNITFGKPYIESKYNQVIRSACLQSDFKIFPKGDSTIVGQRGITVSGGQKARISFARAIYSDADIYLLDDPISAVDAKVARKLYQDVIVGMLKNKTVILVTHQVHYLSHCDKLIIMKNGSIQNFGTPEQLQSELAKFMIQQGGSNKGNNSSKPITMKAMLQEVVVKKNQVPESDAKPLTDSKQQSVDVSIKTYFKYMFYNKKYIFILFTLCLFFLAEGINTAFFRILSKYDDVVSGDYNIAFNLYWMTLGILQLGFFIVLVLKYFCINFICLKSNELLHNNMLISLLRSPTGYFDTVPTGRLINRFSNDLSLMDTTLAYTLIDNIEGPILSIVMLVNVFQIIPIFTAPGVVNVILLVLWFFYCKRSIIHCKLLDLRTKSPVFNNITSVTNGIVQIKIYNMRRNMNLNMQRAINDSMRANNSYWFASRVFGIYISYVSIAMAAIGIFIGIKTAKDPGIYGVAIVFILQLIDFIQWLLRQLVNMESIMVSVERAYLIAHLPDEGPLRTEYDESIGFKDEIQAQIKAEDHDQIQVPKTQWPSQGSIQMRGFTMRYRKDFNPVLKNLSFLINHGQKVGIVGRTGAGKSSIIQAVFRMVPGDEGSQMLIGNNDALSMGLHSLRKNLSIIPQSPFLFKGTIRQNIDPFSEQSQQRIWKVLEQSDLKSYVETLPNKLQTQISSTSQVFSVGQKQLICLARAILRSSKILFLDQATSNVDMRTDDYIQRTLKIRFQKQTIVTIAHRLNTIADYDKVIVMDKGCIVQMGSPIQLLTNSPTDTSITKTGVFAQMVLSTGDNANNIFNLAKNKYLKTKGITNI